MEGTDVFAGQEIGDDDPFAGTDFGDVDLGAAAEPATTTEAPRPVPEADIPADTSGLPTVDREGNVLPAEPAAPTPPPERTPEAQAALDAMKEVNAGTAAAAPVPEPTPVVPEQGPGVREPDPTPAAPAAASPPTESTPTPSAAPAATEASSEAPAESAGPTEPVEHPEEVGTPQPDNLHDDGTPRAAAGEEPAEPGDAAPPAELKDKSGRTTHRRYVILKVLGNGKYETITWYVNSKGDMVQKGTAGAKRQKYALCRGQDEALKIGYAALGSPPKATIVATALSAFQERTVEPEEPKPERARLKIS